ncbi:MAG: Extracellular solute-binding protein [Candidatus Moranbacteria bacterium GW2011_GWC2_37_8]|nr:MAG: Extracellular solute-binding protein [Candidatus Moranbacteria bacterium GW2011_GWC2_37_8]KKQ63338.1 MAG: Extracellular solute-binding protein [Parcubacteria group bacterium GW2011_GWC1_38_22]
MIIAVSFVVWAGSFYFDITKTVPKFGGQYIEGIVGQPLYVNPLISQTSEADSDLAQIIFSGLFKYDKSGNVVPDLAQDFTISEDQKTYTINLKKNVLWHDGEPLAVDDVFFTYSVLQDPAYKSPLRQGFQGVDVSIGENQTIVFNLKSPYVGFLDNLTVGILPKHIWENIAPEKFALAEYNLHPIGSGPFAFSDFQKDSNGNILTFTLAAFKNYYDGKAYISKMTFNFYPDDTTLIAAYNKKEVMGMGSIPPENVKDIKNVKSTNLHELVIPRYFSVFLNQTKSLVLANDEVRLALNMSVDRKQIIETLLHGEGAPLSSPFFPQMKGYDESKQIQTDMEAANKKLDEAGWVLDTNENVRKKGTTTLEFELVTTDWPELNQTANLLKEQWAKVGAKVNVKVLSVSDLQQNYIKTREYDSLLFGQAISFNPDLYSFWHSSQKRDPGLNLSLFDNKEADGILENVRQEMDENVRNEDFKKFQSILADEVPAVFLYGRYYLFPTSAALQGIDAQNINNPQQRFVGVDKWFVKTSRVLK